MPSMPTNMIALTAQTKTTSRLADCIVRNDTMHYSPEAVRYPCTSCLLPAFVDA